MLPRPPGFLKPPPGSLDESQVIEILLVLLAVGLWREGASTAARALPAAVGLGFLAKVGFEAVTGQALFVEAAGLFEPVPLAHLVGGVLGLLVGALPSGRAGQARALVTGQP